MCMYLHNITARCGSSHNACHISLSKKAWAVTPKAFCFYVPECYDVIQNRAIKRRFNFAEQPSTRVCFLRADLAVEIRSS